ncbi:MAG TPA: DEAD/DEAH box helicase, partial [Verrucomicrobiota bacterium]|nr:DEAD/DEAH box helicase [Verrucomicrobiota bacterium]
MLPDSPVTRWFAAKYGTPTPAQAAAWPHVAAGRNVLIVSPTGTGKTFAAFLAVLNDLALAHARGGLTDAVHCLYVSPLRALSYDLEKNLTGPLREIYGPDPPIRVGLRTGDTPAAERARQAAKPPHLLLTTPESLGILLSQQKWLGVLRHVRRVIVDEVHALAENKRGAQLGLSLERLDHLGAEGGQEPLAVSRQPSAIQRLGLSATVAPLDEVAGFLAGAGRPCDVVDVSADKRVELDVYTPLQREPYPAAGYTGARLLRELAALVQVHRTTLVFTNTRSGAETATFRLKEALPELAERIECHHASLDRDVRQDVEDRLKRGELRAVVCSTSLELGIDIGSVDLVVMLASPKGVARALQRAGRSGHSIRTVSRGLLMATNLNDLVECCATARLARRRHLDTLRLPEAPLDVLAQHLVGMGCTARWTCAGARALVRGAWAYRGLTDGDFDDVLDYL